MSACFSGLARQNDVVFSKWFFTNTFKFVFVLFLCRLVFESQSPSYLTNPWRPESQLEVLNHVLLNNLLAWGLNVETFNFAELGLLKSSHYFPFLARIVLNWDVLLHRAASRDTEL